jgi:hypothetical protein
MKPPWIVLAAALALCALSGGVMWHIASNRAAGLSAEVAQLKVDNAKLNADVTAGTERAEELEAESAQLRAARSMASSRLEPGGGQPDLDAAPTLAQEQGQPPQPGGFLAKMFKNPEMRSTLASQQGVALRNLYADYLKEVSLTPEEAGRFFQILQDRQMALMDSSESALSGGAVDMKAATAAANTADDALKELLGPERFGLYQQFEKTLGPRVQVAQFNQQLAGQGAPLRGYQIAALIQIMSQESAAMPALGNSASAQQAAADIDHYAQQMDAANRRVCRRAKSVLTPAQLAALAVFQKNTTTTQIAGLKMATQTLDQGQ